jgi:importin subunit beta-1
MAMAFTVDDPSPHVRDTGAWCLAEIWGAVADLVPAAMLNDVFGALLKGLESTRVNVGHYACTAITRLAEVATVENGTSPVSPHFKSLVETLLGCISRNSDMKLLTACYEAINALITSAAPDVLALVAELLEPLMNELAASLQAQTESLGVDERQTQLNAQALLCGSLQTIILRLEPKTVLDHAVSLMQLFNAVLQAKDANCVEGTGPHRTVPDPRDCHAGAVCAVRM